MPLAEAWGSGAKRWTRTTRRRFANDLRDRRALVAVTDNVNQSQGARDPAQWLPRYGKCRYVRQWTAIKPRWDLAVHRREKRRLANVAGRCRNTVLRLSKPRLLDAKADPCVDVYDAALGCWRH